MKPHHFAYLPLVIGAAFSAAALAQNVNMITFTGIVEQPTCVVKLSGTDTGNMTVDLGTVKTLDFKNIGIRKNYTTFKIQVAGCPPGIRPFAHFYTTKDALDGHYLRNVLDSSDAADGIAVYISTNLNKLYPISTSPDPKRAPGDPSFPTKEDGNAELIYHAEFVRTGKMTPGVFSARMNYIVHYD